MNTINILQIPIAVTKKQELINYLSSKLTKNNKIQIATVNAEFIIESTRNQKFKDILITKTFNTADGISVRAAAYYLNLPKPKNIFLKFFVALFQGLFTGILIILNKNLFTQIPETISGSDFFWDIIKIAQNTKKSIYLLGSTQKNLEIVTKQIKSKYPGLIIAGFSNANANDPELPKIIANTHPDILFVGFGAPKQEIFLEKNSKIINYQLGIGIGGTFDFVSNSIKRAPKIFRNLGLEWFWRLIIEPKRFKRIFKAVVLFPIKIFIFSLKQDGNKE